MLKKLSMLLLLSALCMWAADFWTNKPFTEWSDKEVAKILSNSPWAEKVTIAGGLGRGGGAGIAESAGGGRGGRGGGGGGGRGGGPQGDSGGADAGADGGGAGGLAGPTGIEVTLLWQTAAPVKQALIKRQYGAEAGTSPEAKAKLEHVDEVYVLTLINMPRFTLAAAAGDQKAQLLALTTISVSGKPPLNPIEVQVSGGRGPSGNVSFLFPKTTTFTAADKELEFATKFDKTGIKKKFKLKDMVFNGKVEM